MGLNNQTTVTAELGKELYCQHCTYIWTYRGQNPFHTACPHCGYRVRIHLAEARARKKGNEIGRVIVLKAAPAERRTD